MSLSYIPRTWRERLGTNLNKFTKSSETASSVILENAPDAITQAGTPFTAAAMQNIENGVGNGYWFEETALGQTSRSWYGIAAAPNGDVYACVPNGDIYKQSGGTGNFTALGQTPQNWQSMAAAPNGDIYAAVVNGDIYKQSGGTGNFTALGQTPRQWIGMAAAPNGDIYACVYAGKIYKQSGGVGNFVAVTGLAEYWQTMTAAPNGDVYAAVYAGDIYKQSGGTGNFTALGQTPRQWIGMAAAPNGDIYACVYAGKIYKQSGGVGNFVALNQTARNRNGMAAAPNGNIYAVVNGGDIYTFRYTHITPASILPVTVTTADVTVTENRFQTIRFSGALTGNRTVTWPSDVRQYKLICDCTGAYYIHVKTASGTGVYLAPGDAADVYCDGTNIVMEKLTRTIRSIGLTYGSGFGITAGVTTTLTGMTKTGDVFGSFNTSTGVFTAKNSGWYRIRGVLGVAGTGVQNRVSFVPIRASDSAFFLDSDRLTGSTTIAYQNASTDIYLAAGDSVTLRTYIETGTTCTIATFTALTISPVV